MLRRARRGSSVRSGYRFVGGTSKYTGISRDQKFQGNFIGDTGAGWSDWSGEDKLP
jgi:hypothetical protein